jgi:hypothetical protein
MPTGLDKSKGNMQNQKSKGEKEKRKVGEQWLHGADISSSAAGLFSVTHVTAETTTSS